MFKVFNFNFYTIKKNPITKKNSEPTFKRPLSIQMAFLLCKCIKNKILNDFRKKILENVHSD